MEIHGSGFVPGSEVFFGPLPVPWVEWLSATRLRAATPPGAGRVAVTVASVYGAALMEDAWEYIGETLRIDAMTPEAGPAGGGIEVTFTGAGLGLADVWFDGIPADVRLRTDAMLVVVAPPRAAGAVDVLVGDGISLAVLRFEYVSAGGVFVRGDVDADGAIAINDAILILSILFAGEPPPSCEDRADVNDDGALNIADAIRLLGYLFGGGEPPPPPFPDPGPDPTEDELVCP